jgi:hypothetical protein
MVQYIILSENEISATQLRFPFLTVDVEFNLTVFDLE